MIPVLDPKYINRTYVPWAPKEPQASLNKEPPDIGAGPGPGLPGTQSDDALSHARQSQGVPKGPKRPHVVYGIYNMVYDLEYMAFGIGYIVGINKRILQAMVSGFPWLNQSVGSLCLCGLWGL